MAKSCRSSRKGFTLVELLIVIALVGVLVSLLLPAVMAARETVRRTHCGSNLRQLGLATLQYEGVYRKLPPGAYSDPTLQSRILPFLGLPADFGMDGSPGPGIYLCPSDGYTFEGQETNYALDRGLDTEVGDGVFDDIKHPRDLASCLDGTSVTTAWSEVVVHSHMLEVMDAVGSRFPGHRHRTAYTVESAESVFPGPSPQMFRPLCQSAHRDRSSRWWSLRGWSWRQRHHFDSFFNHEGRPNQQACFANGTDGQLKIFPPTSFHPGGVNVAWLDGHVTFISDDIDNTLWHAVGTVAGGEPVSL